MASSSSLAKKMYCLLWCVILCVFTQTAYSSTEDLSKDSFYYYLHAYDLKDQNNQPLDYFELKNHLVLVNFIFTHCPHVCPTQTVKLGQIYKRLPDNVKNKIKFLSITIDPERDTPAVLKKHAKQLKADHPYWAFATGPLENIEKIKSELQLMDPSKENPALDDHRMSIWLLDDTGLILQRYRGSPMDQERIQKELVSLHNLRFKK